MSGFLVGVWLPRVDGESVGRWCLGSVGVWLPSGFPLASPWLPSGFPWLPSGFHGESVGVWLPPPAGYCAELRARRKPWAWFLLPGMKLFRLADRQYETKSLSAQLPPRLARWGPLFFESGFDSGSASTRQRVRVNIAAPLPDIAMHVVKAPRVCFFLAHLVGVRFACDRSIPVKPGVRTEF